jgi:hypothetical protein
MKHIKLFENFGLDEIDKLDKRMKDLEARGFKQDRVGMRNDDLPGSLMFHQIEDPSDEEWTKFLKEVDEKIK